MDWMLLTNILSWIGIVVGYGIAFLSGIGYFGLKYSANYGERIAAEKIGLLGCIRWGYFLIGIVATAVHYCII